VGTILDDQGSSFWEFLQTGGTICHRHTARQSEGKKSNFLCRTGSALLVRQEGNCIYRSRQEGPLSVSRAIILLLTEDRRVLLWSVDRNGLDLSTEWSSTLDRRQESLALLPVDRTGRASTYLSAEQKICS
jgi:hypothetical protein